MRQAQVINGAVSTVLEATPEDVANLPGTWIDTTDQPHVGSGWLYDGQNFTAPPPSYRTRVTPSEFVELFPAAAYLDIKTNLIGTNAEITQLYEFAFLKETINLESAKMAAAMALLVANSSLTQAEADAILQGIPE